MKIINKKSLLSLSFLISITLLSHAQSNPSQIIVPKGFSVSVLAEDLGSPRHLTVAKNGDIYVNRKADKGLVLLKDNSGDGIIDERKIIGEEVGTGVLANDRYLYFSSNTSIYRYELDENYNLPEGQEPDKIVGGLIDNGRDNAKPFVMDDSENLYVTIGSWNDPCRAENSGKGMMPCPILKEAGGIWKFNGRILNQSLSTGTRYATGLKNAVAIDWNTETNSLFTVVHGRGQFHDFYPQYYTAKQSAELPAEAMYELKKGDNAGWPYIYYDQFKKKKMVAPEYGGDGKKTGGDDAIDPVMAFPAHLGPNDLLFYTGDLFPKKYQNGAFIAFHGQSPELKKGYFVAFVPFKNGKPKGKWEIFADNFAGVDLANPSGPIQHRPCGLAIGLNGELYVSDDLNGTIFKIEYKK
ncbi:PQQ-dependent sugar dehydrogenase [Arcticibacterium luteifluviistationis]|uniref:Sorbosone dehydrogenase n=1 Tax=Arcticibacterium luteifluviistationis TaxID=1784714 RepID=A0A2Z4GFX0_9BACT|nr:PQQ-dependent sugar dehydrogenase [Arcticibacterium luteifluviistationis]AWW00293.1 sorbosone dehydrogenase [Arcticibacterium luteifluviistationis]